MERPGPLPAAPDVPQHVRRPVRLHAARPLGRALRPRPVQGPRVEPAQKVPPDGGGRQLISSAALRISFTCHTTATSDTKR